MDTEQRIRVQIGDLVITNAILLTKVEELTAENEALKKAATDKADEPK